MRKSGTLSNLTRRRRLLFVICAVGLSLVLSLILVELVMRAWVKAPRLPVPVGSLQNDPYTGTALVPNYRGYWNASQHVVEFRTNSKGLRDVERSYAKPKGVFRVLIMGDSYVQGHGVEYERMFPTVLEQELETPPGYSSCQVIKAGVGGWGPPNELEYLKHEGKKYDPDVVMVAFYTGNDYFDTLKPDQYVAYRGIRLERGIARDVSPWRDLRITLRKYCYLYGYLVDMIKALKASPAEKSREDLLVLQMADPRPPPPSMQPFHAVFKNFRTFCQENEFRLIVLILPHRIQVEKDRARRVGEEFGIAYNQLDLDRPSDLIKDVLTDLQIETIDMTPELRKFAESHPRISFSTDTHYNEKTHAFIGQRLAGMVGRKIKIKSE